MMGKLTGLCGLLLLAVLNVAVTEDIVTPVYFTDGGNLTLEVRPPFQGEIVNILWKFNGDLLAEWVKDKVPLGYYPRIDGRANLTIETGQLIINKMKKEDEAVYSVSINDRVQSESYRAKLIENLQKAKIEKRTLTCGADSESCKFSCEPYNIGAEPITYSWKKGDGEWKVSGRYINITSKEDSGVETFTCRMENPVSREESDPEHNPLYKEPKPDNTGAVVWGVLGGLVGIGAVAGLLVAWIKKIGPFNTGSTNITNPENGNVQPTPPSDNATNPPETVPLQANPEDTKSDAKETA